MLPANTLPVIAGAGAATGVFSLASTGLAKYGPDSLTPMQKKLGGIAIAVVVISLVIAVVLPMVLSRRASRGAAALGMIAAGVPVVGFVAYGAAKTALDKATGADPAKQLPQDGEVTTDVVTSAMTAMGYRR